MMERKRPLWIWIASLVAIIFGLLTIKSGGTVLFFDGAARQAAGRYVPIILWFNFIAGFLYVTAGIGLWLRQQWARWLATSLALATLLAFAVLGMHILSHGEYEMRTVYAMTVRSVVWVTIACLAWFLWPHRVQEPIVKE
ncbi:MAG TPA: hypothetical protein VGE00_01000 [Gammaproteobacteria bacterium]